MADENESFVHDLLLPDSNTRRFHVGDACQWLPSVPENEVLPEVAAMIQAHRDSIHAPGSRRTGQFGLDEDGNPIETSYLGVGVDPESGALVALDKDGNPREGVSGSGSRVSGERAAGRGREPARNPASAQEAREQARAQSPETRNPKPETKS